MNIRHCLGLVSKLVGIRDKGVLTTAYLHVLHVVQNVLLVLFGGCSREFLGQRLLPELADLACVLALRRRTSVKSLIIVFDEKRLAVAVSRVLALNRSESHDEGGVKRMDVSSPGLTVLLAVFERYTLSGVRVDGPSNEQY